MSAQVSHSHCRPPRVGNHHRNDVTVFRFEVLDHYVNVHDIRFEAPVTILPWCFVATTEFKLVE